MRSNNQVENLIKKKKKTPPTYIFNPGNNYNTVPAWHNPSQSSLTQSYASLPVPQKDLSLNHPIMPNFNARCNSQTVWGDISGMLF